MRLPPLEAARARDLVAAFAGQHVLVAGDVMLDRFIVGDVTRISPEAPVPVVAFASEHARLGGAANVAQNIAALGGRVSLVGVVGRDPTAATLREALDAGGAGASGLVDDADRRTTEKVRIVTRRNQQIARIDYERDDEIGGAVERAVLARIRELGRTAGALVASDYLKGVVTRPVMEALLEVRDERRLTASADPPVVVDPKIPHLACYSGATLITPNLQEAEIATHRRIRTDAEAREAAREFRVRARCGAAIVTRGEHGLWLSSEDAEGAVAASVREVADVTGAGDTVVATLALALAAGATLAEAAVLANFAAGIVVGRFGPSTVTGEELIRSAGL
jgi:D-beta-D-heptose 7-phosphate kinase/D-beta-D-heptose 1-phosphate adenosyltransferase